MDEPVLEKLLHLPHVAADAATRRALEDFYLDVFGAQTYFEAHAIDGLEREESLILIGDLSLVPASPTDRTSEHGKQLGLYAGRLSQIAIKVKDTETIDAHLRRHGLEPIYLRPRHRGLFFLTNPAETMQVRFEFCAVDLPNDLRLRPNWSSDWWRNHHPLGIERLGSVVTATSDLARARHFYQHVLQTRHIGDRSLPDIGANCSAFIIGDDVPFVLEVWQPTIVGTPLADFIDRFDGGIYGVVFKVGSLAACRRHLNTKGVSTILHSDGLLAIDPKDGFGANLMMLEEDAWPI